MQPDNKTQPQDGTFKNAPTGPQIVVLYTRAGMQICRHTNIKAPDTGTDFAGYSANPNAGCPVWPYTGHPAGIRPIFFSFSFFNVTVSCLCL